MNENCGIFGANSDRKTSADVADAIVTIDAAIQQGITKTVLRDLVMGLKILTSSMEHPDEELAFSTIIKWLKLYLRIENALSPRDSELREQFENYIPITVSYIAIALHLKPTNIQEYHFQLLKLSLELLEVVTEETLRKVAGLKPALVAYLWRPIQFVGDFNTQFLVLRLISKLLKCMNSNKQKQILERICSTQQKVLKEKICSAVELSNFQVGMFENAARALLNNFNSNLSKHVRVYSMRCREVQFGNAISFYKPLHAQCLWVDLNYSPGTATFNGRYKADSKDKFIDVDVCVKIHELKLNKEILTVVSNAAPHFSKTICNQNNLRAVRNIRFVLCKEQVLCLRQNDLVLKHFNKTRSNNNGEHVTTSEDASNYNDNNTTAQPPSNNKERIKNKGNDDHATATISEASTSAHFKKSFSLLIGKPGNRGEQHGSQTMLELPRIGNENITSTSLSHCKNALIRANLSQQDNRKDLSLSSDPNDVLVVQKPCNIGEEILAAQTPKTVSRNQSDPIVELTEDTTKESCEEHKQDAKKIKKTKPRHRFKKGKINKSPLKRKPVNKVPPLNRLARRYSNAIESIQRYVVTFADFLRNEDESAAVFNEGEHQIVPQNVNLVNENIEGSTQRFFRDEDGSTEMPNSSAAADNVSDIINDSVAEPGQPKVNELLVESLNLRKNAGNIVQKPKKMTVENDSEANPEKRNDQEATTSKAIEKLKPKTRKRPKKRPMVKKSSGVVDGPIPSEANAFTSSVDAESAANSNENKQISSTNANAGPPEKKVKFLSKLLCNKPQNDKTYTVNLLSDEEFNNCEQDLMSSSDKLTKDSQQTYVLKSRQNFITVDNVKPSNDETIIPTTRQLQNGQSENSLQQSDEEINDDEIGIEIQSQNIDDHEASNDPLIGWKEAHCKSSLLPRDKMGRFIELNDIQEKRQAVVSTEQVTSFDEILLAPTQILDTEFHSPIFSDILNVSNINEPQYNTLEEQPTETDLEGIDNSLETMFNNNELACTTPNDVSVKSISKRFITKSTKKSSMPVLEPNIKNCQMTTSVTTREVIRNDIVAMRPRSICSRNIVPLQKESSIATVDPATTKDSTKVSDQQRNEISKYFNSYLETNEELDVVHNPPYKDVSDILEKFKRNMDLEFEKLQPNNTENNEKLESYSEKLTQVTKRLLHKAKKERKKLKASKKQIKKLLKRINFYWEKYEQEAKYFNRYKQHIETFLNSVVDIDFTADINKEFETSMATLNTVSNKVRTELWKEYVKDTAENFVENISKLSDL